LLFKNKEKKWADFEEDKNVLPRGMNRAITMASATRLNVRGARILEQGTVRHVRSGRTTSQIYCKTCDGDGKLESKEGRNTGKNLKDSKMVQN